MVPALVLMATACAPAPPVPAPASAPMLDPLRFFVGESHGEGILRIALHRPRHVAVASEGRIEPDGTLRLDQRVAVEGRPERRRTWRIRAVAPGRYAGTLSDAAGPVTGEATGDTLRLRFALSGPLRAEQRLVLEPGGRVALNRLTVRALGVRVATLTETITRN